MTPEECCFPNCRAALSTKVHLPLCDRHMVKVYREVASLMGETRPAEPSRGVVAYAPSRPRGTIYIVQFGDRIKIGYTTDMRTRMTAIPHDRVLATLPGTMSTEKALHHQFRHLHIKGEWFRAEGDLLAFAAEHAVTRRQSA